jgi:DNA polymerase-3 subunit delta
VAKTKQVPWSGIMEAPVVLLTGPEAFLADRASRALLERLKSVTPELELVDLDASTAASGELVQAVSPSLFGEPRMVRLWSFEKTTDGVLEDVVDYLANPDPTVTLLIRHSSGVRGKKALDLIKTHGGDWLVVTCPELKSDRDRAQFLRAEANAKHVRIEEDAERMLLDAIGSDLAELAAGLSQLTSDVGEGAPITAEVVKRYYGGRVETTGFELAEHAIAGRRGDALAGLRHALNTGVEPVMIIAALAHSLRNMARVGGTRGSVADVSKELGLQSWQVQRARSQLQGWDEVGLGVAIMEVARTDAALKGMGAEPGYALERCVDIVARRGQVPVVKRV